MAERKRSNDGYSETEEFRTDEAVSAEQGRAGGDLARLIGSEDEAKRNEDRPAGRSRPRKSDEERAGTSNLGQENR